MHSQCISTRFKLIVIDCDIWLVFSRLRMTSTPHYMHVPQHLRLLSTTFTQCLFLGILSTHVVDNDNTEDE